MTSTINPPPPASVEPVTDILHGVSVTDPYRWLEDQNSPQTRRWLNEQTGHTRAYFDAIPRRERIRQRVEELLAVEVVFGPWKVGEKYFYLKRKPHQEQAVIMMREGNSAEEVILVDPTDRGEGSTTAVTILNISKDGNLLAYGIRHGGEDSQSAEFLDVARTQVLSDRLPPGLGPSLVFSPDGRGFYYSHEIINSACPHYRAAYWHEFGSKPDNDIEIFFAGDDPKLHLAVFGSADGQHLGYLVIHSGDPVTVDLHLQDLSEGNPSRKLLEGVKSIFAPFFIGERLFALTDWRAPNRRIVRVDLNHPEPEHWCDVVPESDSRIQSIAVVGESLFVTFVQNISTRVEVFHSSGKNLGPIPLPSRGTASLFPCRPDTDTVFYRFTSFQHPPSILSYRAQTGEQKTWARSEIEFDPSSVEIEEVRYPSKDGTLVPMFLVSQKGRRAAGPLPTFLTGYGGFGSSITPQFTAHSTYLMERGCLFAVANLRGGAEFGEAWHLAAKRQKRQTAIDDFIAAAGWLLAEEHTQAGRLAIGGGSNAGLLVGAALTQRPDLFRAVICLGPLLDMLRYHLFDTAESWIDEYGNAEIAGDFHALVRYSPYHAVENGTAYPALMLITGDADTRCNPMHARKMAARLQAATSSEHPILLDYRAEWGHTPVQPLTRRINALTDRLAFLCHELGLDV
jgi:prolyl oligopeptidase